MENKSLYLVITPFFPSNTNFVGSYIFDQLNELRKQSSFNIQVVKVVSLFSFEEDYEFRGFYVHIFRTIDFPFFIFPGLFNSINKIRFRLFLTRRKIMKIRFSHSHVSYPSVYLVEDLVCKKVVQHHGLDVLQLMNGRSNFIRSIQRRFLIRNTIRHLNNVDINIGVSHLVLEQLSKYVNYNPKNEFVLYNGVDTSKFFEKVTADNDIFTIGCVANFWKIKNQILLIKAVQKILERRVKIKLRLIGSGETLNFCKKYVSKYNLSEFISFDNNIAHEQLNDFYNKIDLFVLPSYYEALGCVYLEAWATNTPFIGGIGQGISEIVPDKEKMLVVQDDIEDLVSKIMYFINDDFKLDSIRNFAIEKTINDFLSLQIFRENV